MGAGRSVRGQLTGGRCFVKTLFQVTAGHGHLAEFHEKVYLVVHV